MTEKPDIDQTPWYRGLFVLMICLIALAAFPHADFLRSLIFTVFIFSAVYAAGGRGRTRVIGIVLGVIALAFTWIESDATRELDAIVGAVFLAYIIGTVSARLIRTQAVTANAIWAGICVYLLIPVLWTRFYALAIYACDSPEQAFRGLTLAGDPSAGSWMNQISYFSLVTVTTLGFGDITPLTLAARRLTTAEALVGQLFLAIFIARLVGLHLAARVVSE